MSPSETTWKRVSKASPCPICGKPDWCSTSGPEESPEAVICMRVESDHQCGNGGWLHHPEGGSGSRCSLPPRPRPPLPEYATRDEAVDAWHRLLGNPSALYIYTDARGQEVGFVARWEKPTGKTIRQARRLPNGFWVHQAIPAPKPLYRLSDLPEESGQVFLVEGEKCAEALWAIGLVATTWLGGSSAVSKADFVPLSGRNVVLLADNDPPGKKAMDEVHAQLAKLTKPPTIRRLELPGLPEKGDVVDWIDVQEGEPDLIAGTLEQLVNDCRPIEAPINLLAPELICLAEVKPRQVDWLWQDRVAAGRLSLLSGMPGVGKSFVTCDMAMRITTGTPWPDGATCKRGSVLLITSEDDLGDTIRPRLDAHGADVRRVHQLVGIVQTVADRADRLGFSLTDIEQLRNALDRLPDCRLVVIDPIGSFLGGRTDAHRDNEVRAVLAPVAQLAEQHGAAILIVAHCRKARATHADDTVLGSRAFTGLARSVWHLWDAPNEQGRKLILPGKSNLAQCESGLAFRIEGDPPSVAWEREPVTMTASEALAKQGDGQAETTAIEEAKRWLVEKLQVSPRRGQELRRESEQDGIAWRTLERAKGSLGVRNAPSYFHGPWVWSLAPEFTNSQPDSSESAKGVSLADSAETVADPSNESP